MTKDNKLIIGSDTFRGRKDTVLRVFNKNGKYINTVKSPKYLMLKYETYTDNWGWGKETVKTRGIQTNKGIEAMSLAPSGNKLYIANEEPAVQDLRKNVLRISMLEKESGEFEPSKTYLYKLENEYNNGLAEILAVDEKTLLTLERSYDDFTRKVTVNIFKVRLSAEKEFNDEKVTRKSPKLEKELVLDLDHLLNNLPPGLRRIDNLEGMAFGPKLPNGNRTLILVSDNNFNPSQKTQFIFLEIK